jgi:2-oxoglutarate ferredoxin oxidoreductase subunit delta
MAEANGKAGDRGRLDLDAEECKGCGLCVEACPPRVLRLAAHLNRFGYHPVTYVGEGCSGCGICFFACPEPGAITVWRERVRKPVLNRAA